MTAKNNQHESKVRRILLALAGPVLIVMVWQIAHSSGAFDQSLLPSPLKTFSSLLSFFSTGHILPHLVATLWRMAVGFLLAAAAGVAVGLLLGVFRPLFESFMVVVDFFRSTPVTTLYP